MTYRAVEVLRDANSILAEDTRHARILLTRYAIRVPMVAYHAHNEARATARALERLGQGDRIALITDAGTPLLSDPGARVVSAAIEAGHVVVPVPGALALLAALVAAGLSAGRFTFFGFLPRRGPARAAVLAEIAALSRTAVIYEAPGRAAGTLADIAAAGAGGRRAAVARELTKRFEEIRRGTVADLAAYYEASPPRGEIVLVIEGGGDAAPAREGEEVDAAGIRERVRSLRAAGASAREIMAALTAAGGVSRNAAYRFVHEDGSRTADREGR